MIKKSVQMYERSTGRRSVMSWEMERGNMEPFVLLLLNGL